MRTSLFDYNLPTDLIASSPVSPRDHSRLMVINRKTGKIEDKHFYNIVDYLTPNDVLVLNKTKVFPARLIVNKVTGGRVELLFLEEIKPGIWKCLTHPGLKKGNQLTIKKYLFDVVGHEGMESVIDTHLTKDKLMDLLKGYGHTPIPPYIKSKDTENKLRVKYQTVYADTVGSAAAPTAGFHFTSSLLKEIKKKGVQVEYVTLHVGLGTFTPVKTKEIENHPMHSEEYYIDGKTAKRLYIAKVKGKRIISVGTTTTRTLESVSNNEGKLDLKKLHGSTNIFIYPGYKFKFVDSLVTNFHLPKSTLLTLVSAFVSFPNTKEKFESFNSSLIGKAYKKAIKEKYRFYSFGDASLII